MYFGYMQWVCYLVSLVKYHKDRPNMTKLSNATGAQPVLVASRDQAR
jgi:hypothetical protein